MPRLYARKQLSICFKLFYLINATVFISEEDSYADELVNDSLNIEQTDNSFRLRILIPSVYFKYIIGKRGETKRRLENDTRTQIRIPKQGEEGNIGKLPIYVLINLGCCNLYVCVRK